MKFERDGKYIMRGSKEPAEFLCYDKLGRTHFLCGGHVNERNKDGTWGSCDLPEFDIVPAPKKHKKWMNIYSYSLERKTMVSTLFASKDEANSPEYLLGGRIACIEVEFEEGQGL